LLPPSRHIGASDLCSLLKKIEENIRKKIETPSLEILTEESLVEFEAISGLIKEHITKIS
jgi:uncharacterized FAD-dependent dehydrogenase